jgi:hypothetical protein
MACAYGDWTTSAGVKADAIEAFGFSVRRMLTGFSIPKYQMTGDDMMVGEAAPRGLSNLLSGEKACLGTQAS